MTAPTPVPTPNAPPVAGPYSPAVRAGDWIVLAGQVALIAAAALLAGCTGSATPITSLVGANGSLSTSGSSQIPSDGGVERTPGLGQPWSRWNAS